MNNLLKTLLVIVITAGLTFFITKSFYYKNATGKKGMQAPTTQFGTTSIDTYSVTTAANDVKMGMALYQSILDSDKNMTKMEREKSKISAYTVNAEDLICALGLPIKELDNCVYKKIRVYLGYHIDTSAGHSQGFKLFVVPVCTTCNQDTIHCDSVAGCDLFFDYVNGNLSINTNPRLGSYVMDLNVPCPSLCDPKSQINNK